VKIVATNDDVLRCLADRPAAVRGEPLVKALERPKRDYYLNAGAHPEVVERLWDQLGARLAVDCKALVFGAPALVRPDSSIVLAFAMGTRYVMRLPLEVWSPRRPEGVKTIVKWAGGKITDIARDCGEAWIFGSYAAAELGWCEQTFRECAAES
jgi:hypothetical protein